MRVAVTGHRPQHLGGFESCEIHTKVKLALRQTLQALPVSLAYSGMALGVDQWFAEICTELRIPWIACIPCENQDKMWPSESKGRYHALLKYAADQIVVSPGPYAAWKMQTRNCYMVDNCDVLIAVLRSDKEQGGTGNCVDYAKKVGRKIWRLDPCLL